MLKRRQVDARIKISFKCLYTSEVLVASLQGSKWKFLQLFNFNHRGLKNFLWFSWRPHFTRLSTEDLIRWPLSQWPVWGTLFTSWGINQLYQMRGFGHPTIMKQANVPRLCEWMWLSFIFTQRPGCCLRELEAWSQADWWGWWRSVSCLSGQSRSYSALISAKVFLLLMIWERRGHDEYCEWIRSHAEHKVLFSWFRAN